MHGSTLLECTVPVQSFKTHPYLLPWGADVYAKVIAINVYGASQESDAGNGAAIITYPDAPINLSEDYSLRTATAIGLQWEEGTANGGSTVLDYQVSYDQASGTEFVLLASGLASTTYTATGLTSGETYQFKL